MRHFGPFEDAPLLAVGVSGGADSLCLTHLASEWAESRGGRIVALHVDHGLRPGSAGEAQALRKRLGRSGIRMLVLRWRPASPPESAIQEKARLARYRLLERACARLGILHLLVAHTLDDQVETVAMRSRRADSHWGQAGMAPCRELRACRLLRPLLEIGRPQVEATLRARGLDWLEDPSNRLEHFERVRIRRGSLDRDQLAAVATAAGRERSQMTDRLCNLLAAAATFSPLGYVMLDEAACAPASRHLLVRLLSALLSTVSGVAYGPGTAPLADMAGRIVGGSRSWQVTLHGCLIRRAGRAITICREPGRLPVQPIELRAASNVIWDRRFDLLRTGGRITWSISPLREWLTLNLPDDLRARMKALPARVAEGLPTVSADRHILAVPCLNWALDDEVLTCLTCRWRPPLLLASSAYGRRLL